MFARKKRHENFQSDIIKTIVNLVSISHEETTKFVNGSRKYIAKFSIDYGKNAKFVDGYRKKNDASVSCKSKNY